MSEIEKVSHERDLLIKLIKITETTAEGACAFCKNLRCAPCYSHMGDDNFDDDCDFCKDQKMCHCFLCDGIKLMQNFEPDYEKIENFNKQLSYGRCI